MKALNVRFSNWLVKSSS